MFSPPCRLAGVLTFAAWCCLTTAARAEEPATASPPATAEQLVGQLGDASYEQRERASRQLLEIGLEARAALDERHAAPRCGDRLSLPPLVGRGALPRRLAAGEP